MSTVNAEVVEEKVATLSVADLKKLTPARSLFNAATEELKNASMVFDELVEEGNGFFIYQNEKTGEYKKMNKNGLLFTRTAAADVVIDDKTEFVPLYKMLVEMAGDNETVDVPKRFKIVDVEIAMVKNSSGDEVPRYLPHQYEQFKAIMDEKKLDINGVYALNSKLTENLFEGINDWTPIDTVK